MSRIPFVLRASCFCLALLSCLGHSSPLLAENGPTTYTLKLKPNPDIAAGQIAIVQSEASQAPDHYLVENLTILQPVEVVLVTKDASEAVKIQLCKHLWGQPEREDSTQGKGSVRFAFRTEGDLKIKVMAPSGTHGYQLAVWAGDALKRPLPSIFAPMDASSKTRRDLMAWMSSPVLWLIAAFLAFIALLLLIIVLRGRRR